VNRTCISDAELGGETENLDDKQKVYRAMMERKTNLYNKLAQQAVVKDMTTDDQTEFDQI
jgi:hypothetical protein